MTANNRLVDHLDAPANNVCRLDIFAHRSIGALEDQVFAPGADQIDDLYAALDLVNSESHPRTAQLLASGVPKMAQKLMEEAGEVAIEAVRHRNRATVRESADLLYNLTVLWHASGIAPAEIWAEMERRVIMLGIAEKLPKRTTQPAEGVTG